MKNFLISLLAIGFVGCGSGSEPISAEKYLQLIQNGEMERAKAMQCQQSILYIPPAIDEFEIISEQDFRLEGTDYPMFTAKINLNGTIKSAAIVELTPDFFVDFVEHDPALKISQSETCFVVEGEF